MCLDLKQKEVLRPQVLEMSKIIRHRGPDWSGILVMKKRFYLMSVWYCRSSFGKKTTFKKINNWF
jgi:asparagine synthetase B (glutamine-hydrolysing)